MNPTEEPIFFYEHQAKDYQENCLTQQQKQTLQQLVESIAFNNPKTTQNAIWLGLIQHCNVENYHLIKKENYNQALDYLTAMT